MEWKFWRTNRQSPEQIRLDDIQRQLSGMAEHLAFIAEKVVAGNEQMHKWSRFQYKTTQETQSDLDKLGQTMESALQWQAEKDYDSARIEDLESALDDVSAALIRWLDDIDHLCMQLPKQDNEEWLKMLRQWADQLLSTLEALDIREIHIQDRSFDPRFAESLGTVPERPVESEPRGSDVLLESASAVQSNFTVDPGRYTPTDSKVPFRIVSVVKRGFMRGQGTILRKAHVITLQYNGGEE